MAAVLDRQRTFTDDDVRIQSMPIGFCGLPETSPDVSTADSLSANFDPDMRTCLRAGAVVAVMLALQLAGSSQAAGPAGDAEQDGTRIEEAKALLEGTFELDEWNVGGKALRPPQVEGRFSIHDGVILFMTTRHDGSTVESIHGWGVYSITADGWSYGYRHLETVRGPADGPLARVPNANPLSPTLLKLQWDGPKLIVIGRGTDRREYTRESFVSAIGSAGDFRRWRRVQGAGSRRDSPVSRD